MNEIIEKEDIKIENMIYEIRGVQAMLDSDLARLYKVETKYLKRQVRRNIDRFPKKYCFELTSTEYDNILRCQNGTLELEQGKFSKYLPFVFTEEGVAMLAGVLHSDIAVKTSIKIIDTFVAMRHYIGNNLLEQKYINNQVMKNTEDIKLLQESLSKFEEKRKVNEIYFNGQIFDAYSKIYEIFNEAKEELIIIDSYADNTLLDIVKRLNIDVTIITKKNGLLTKQDIDRYNMQYHNLKVKYDNTFHDRYFILDNSVVYHCGASINRIGYKTFSITKINDVDICKLLIDRFGEIDR